MTIGTFSRGFSHWEGKVLNNFVRLEFKIHHSGGREMGYKSGSQLEMVKAWFGRRGEAPWSGQGAFEKSV